jgi:diguanylate cyclase
LLPVYALAGYSVLVSAAVFVLAWKVGRLAALVELLERDRLTGCLLRQAGERRLPRDGVRGVVVFVDLDGLKAVNDLCGHEAGDRLLALAGMVLRSVTRPGDIVVRWGGDEFLLFMPGAGSEDVPAITSRLEDALAAAGVRASAGLVFAAGEPLEEVVRRADSAMYEKKRASAGGREALAQAV